MSWREVARDRHRPQRAQPRRRIPGCHGVEDPNAPLLTPCVIEVPMAIGNAPSNKGVARRFEIPQHTVKFHLEPVLRKIGASSRTEVVRKSLSQWLLQ
jgi:DNA-binding NarL/FixJ family response regulator